MTKNLEQQLQILIENAPEHGVAPHVIEKAIAPELLAIAKQLNHDHYYLLQSPQKDWVISVMSSSNSPQIEKKVIFAFSSLKAATHEKPEMITVNLPVIELLWQFFSLKQIDSLVFIENQQANPPSFEVNLQHLQSRIQKQLVRLASTPPDIA